VGVCHAGATHDAAVTALLYSHLLHLSPNVAKIVVAAAAADDA